MQKNYDSDFCGKVPLHQTNMIQPHGVLVIVEKSGLRILQVSENISSLLQQPPSAVVATTLYDHIPAEQAGLLQQRFRNKVHGKLPFRFSIGPERKSFAAMVQEADDTLVLEIEVLTEAPAMDAFMDVYQELKFVISAMENAATVEAASQIMIAELKRISGFDRIMIYQFDADWNGTVIAEVMEPLMEPYLGLKFPASDIPKQARDLYRTSPYRLIPNINYEGVPLYPVLNPITHGFTLLSNTNLRSVSAVHLEYLANMKVVASMSTRILKNGALWGLISCHHRAPKYLSHQMCAFFELLSEIFSAKISGIENHASFALRSEMHQLYSRLVENMYKSANLLQAAGRQHQQLMELLKAEGIAVVKGKTIHHFGKTPTLAELEDLVFWLRNNEVNRLHQFDSLSEEFESAGAYTVVASGLLVLPIEPNLDTCLLAFRPEARQQVNWGGNPNEAIRFEADGKRYHPRASFKQWQETVKGHARPWEKEELEIAENFRNFAIEYSHTRSD
jgi:two-component system, chemotaxis family, sensor kinase Cph1